MPEGPLLVWVLMAGYGLLGLAMLGWGLLRWWAQRGLAH